MIIQGVRIPHPDQPWTTGPPPRRERTAIYTGDICGRDPRVTTTDYIVGDRDQGYNFWLANMLCTASTSAYADPDSVARTMHCNGASYNETVGITVTNEAVFLDSTAYVIQSWDRRLLIIAFRGTGPRNTINWLADASAATEIFPTAGYVHGGFFRTVAALWPPIKVLLRYAIKGYSICAAARREKALVQVCTEGVGGNIVQPTTAAAGTTTSERAPDRGDSGDGGPAEDDPDVLEALYITGHSLGGALAVLAAAYLQVDPTLASLREKLGGVYTYGQPRVGYQSFAKQFDSAFGDKLFRHVYGNDVVPRMPPRTAGPFKHFGKEYRSTESGWVYESSRPVTQVFTFLGSSFFGVLNWVQQQLPGVPLLRILPESWSLHHHSPLFYLRASRESTPPMPYGG